jgi:hypothetical protein
MRTGVFILSLYIEGRTLTLMYNSTASLYNSGPSMCAGFLIVLRENESLVTLVKSAASSVYI